MFQGLATFIGGSGADTFIMNGPYVAVGSPGGAGNTFILPLGLDTCPAPTPYADGTIKVTSNGNGIYLDIGGTPQKLTSLVFDEGGGYGDVIDAGGWTNFGYGAGGVVFNVLYATNQAGAHEIFDGNNPYSAYSDTVMLQLDYLGPGGTRIADVAIEGGTWADLGIAVSADPVSEPGGRAGLPAVFVAGPGAGADGTAQGASTAADTGGAIATASITSGAMQAVPQGDVLAFPSVASGGAITLCARRPAARKRLRRAPHAPLCAAA